MIGTGASAVQFVPEIAEQAGSSSSSSARATGSCRARTAPYPRARQGGRSSTSPACRRSGAAFIFDYGESLTAMIRHPRTLGRLGRARSAAFMRWQLRDPEVRRKAWPDYTFGCKRVLFSSHFLPALQRAERRARHRRRSPA